MRAGVACTSAYVPAPDSSDGNNAPQNPPFAKGSRGINILPDTYFSPHEATPVCASTSRKHDQVEGGLIWDWLQDKYDLLVIPGGAKGAETMAGSGPVQHLVRRYLEEGKYVGMVCAGAYTILFRPLVAKRRVFDGDGYMQEASRR